MQKCEPLSRGSGLITNRVRSTTRGYVFSLSNIRGGVYPGQVRTGGYPSQERMGVPQPQPGQVGYPIHPLSWDGVPPSRDGVLPGQGTPIQRWRTPSQGWGTPVQIWGTPPPPRIGQQMEYLICRGRYASCVHAGGLSCYRM